MVRYHNFRKLTVWVINMVIFYAIVVLLAGFSFIFIGLLMAFLGFAFALKKSKSNDKKGIPGCVSIALIVLGFLSIIVGIAFLIVSQGLEIAMSLLLGKWRY